jgi:sodium/bile acid cotransporter 3/5
MYTLGKSIYPDTTTMVPVRNILTTLVSMAVCLGIGLSFQRFFPRAAAVRFMFAAFVTDKLTPTISVILQYCKKVLAPVSVAMIIFIIVFGTYANLYMFRLMTAKILLSAGLCVWSGFLGGFIISTLLRFSSKDRTAISVETGIQNTGIAIVLLGVSLPPPYNDMATVVPVAASIMTPLPLTVVWIGMKCLTWYKRRHSADSLRPDDQTRTISNSSSSTLLPPQANGDEYRTNEKVLPAA